MKKRKTKISAVLLDFHGVLCSDYFYTTLEPKYPEVYHYITTDFFVNSKNIINNWMRGSLTAKEVNAIIAKNTGFEQKVLDQELENSIRLMRLNEQLMDFVKLAKKKNVKTAILTDNMDVFQDIFVPHNKLDTFFDKITSSFDYKQLKGDNDGELLDVTKDCLDVDYDNLIMLDDWPKMGELLSKKGGHFYLYDQATRDKFEDWFNDNYYF